MSIIESDALLELRCPHREGLLLRVMQALHQDLRLLEVTSVQTSSAGDVLLAELRAKVSMEVPLKLQFVRPFLFFLLGDGFDCSVLLNPEVFLDCLVQVKEVHGRRSSITEVKRAIHLIVSSD